MPHHSRLPRPLLQTYAWQEQAACRDEDSAYFFGPEAERSVGKHRREAQAKIVCQQCPVMEACREYALLVREEHGVWGGLTPEERRAAVHQLAG
jgi:WhiB family redox-sensing transcriptional regulator